MRKQYAKNRKAQAKAAGKNSSAEQHSTTPYDDVWRTLTTNLPKLLIPMVNEVFGARFTNRAKVVLRQNEHFFSRSDGKTEKRVTDTNFSILEPANIGSILGSSLSISENSFEKNYIFECESRPVTSAVLIRFVEYSIKAGTELASIDGKATLRITIPKIAILSLRSSANTPSEMRMEVQMESGTASSSIRIMKLSDYDSDSIFEKHLYLLIPFLLFNYEKRFHIIEKDDMKYRAFLEKFQSVYHRIDDMILVDNMEPEDIEASESSQLLDTYAINLLREMTRTIVNSLAKNHPKIRKGVNEVVGGNIIMTESTRILQRGIRQGRKEGLKKGREEGLEKGREEGEKNTLNMVAERMISDGDPAEKIIRLTHLTRKEIDAIAQRLNCSITWNEDDRSNQA